MKKKFILFVTIAHNELLSNKFLFNSIQDILINKLFLLIISKNYLLYEFRKEFI